MDIFRHTEQWNRTESRNGPAYTWLMELFFFFKPTCQGIPMRGKIVFSTNGNKTTGYLGGVQWEMNTYFYHTTHKKINLK
jgi:hypothetical protein